MSRPRRHSPGGMVFHVLNRGVGRRVLFTKDECFLAFERVVEETLRTRRMRLCAYCLMPNHWHFVVWPERDGDLPAFIQQVTNTHISSGSDRFRIFSAQAKGAFQCHEILPRVRFALEQSGESRRQVRNALGAGEAKDRHQLGASGLGMVLRQVGEGGASRRAGAPRGELVPVDPITAAHSLDHPGKIQSSKQALLPPQLAMGLIAEALAQAIQESLTAEE